MGKSNLTAERLRELIRYEPETGEITLLCPKASSWVSATNLKVNIRLDGRPYLAHRLAWLYVHGVWPAGEIDHINRLGNDNRLTNLRIASHALNQQNKTKIQRNSTCGVRGAQRTGSGYQAQIVSSGVRHHLGSFRTAEEAGAAYEAAKARLHRGAVIT